MVSFEEKKILNKQYILNNLSDYSFDRQGGIYNVEKIHSLDYDINDDYGVYFYSEAVADYEEVIDKMIFQKVDLENDWRKRRFDFRFENNYLIVMEILKEKEDWELVIPQERIRLYQNRGRNIEEVTPELVRNKKTGLEIFTRSCCVVIHFLWSELGYNHRLRREWSRDDYLKELERLKEKVRLSNLSLTSSPTQNPHHNTYSPEPPQTKTKNLPPEIIPARKNNNEFPISTQITQPAEKPTTSQKPQTKNEKAPTNNLVAPVLIGGVIMLLLTIFVLKKRKRNK